MIYVIENGEDVLGLVANVERSVVDDCVHRVDICFRNYVDQVPNEMLPAAMCADLGIPFDKSISDWADVLFALLRSKGASEVDFTEVKAIP